MALSPEQWLPFTSATSGGGGDGGGAEMPFTRATLMWVSAVRRSGLVAMMRSSKAFTHSFLGEHIDEKAAMIRFRDIAV